jgi:adenylate cyclase
VQGDGSQRGLQSPVVIFASIRVFWRHVVEAHRAGLMMATAAAFQASKVVLISAAVTLLLALTGITGRSDRWWFDSLQSLTASRAAMPSDTALILIDEHAISVLGQAPFGMRWPWPRGAFAALISGLAAAGAGHIVVDLMFLENSAAAEQDLLLGAVTAGLPGVILATVPDRLPAVWPDEFRAAHPGLFSAAPKWGYVRTTPDSDAVIRRYAALDSLAAAALVSGGAVNGQPREWPDESILLRWRGNLEQLRARGLPVLSAAPFVTSGWQLLDQATQVNPDFDPAGLAEFLAGAAATAETQSRGEMSQFLSGKTVFIGANAAATFDAIATPLGAPEPGVVLQWNAFASLQAGDYLKDPGPVPAWIAALLVLLALPLSARSGGGLQRPALLAAGLLILFVVASSGLFLAGLWFAPGLPMVAIAIAFTTQTVESFRVERARKQEIQGWFGAYVSPAVVSRLLADPDAIELGGELRELSVSFSDIAGFTTISEKLSPPDLVALINQLLEGQTACILDHGGYLDKYIGDAIMAVFGSPEPLENHAVQACRAALAGQAALERFNDEIEGRYGMRLGMRTGINTGPVVVGNVGSSRKKNYTVLGDAVNLASRLEGANKETGTTILLGPQTAAYAEASMVLRPVARLQVKGKTEAVEVSELLAERVSADAATVHFAEVFSCGFRAYCERDFAAAIEAFGNAHGLRPDDHLSAGYLEQSQALLAHPPGPDWQAVLKLESK